MSEVTIGTPLQTYELFLVRRGVQGFTINWFNENGSAASSLNGKTIRVLVGDRDLPSKTYDVVAVSNTTTFNLTSEDTDFDFNRYDGMILLIEGADETPLVDLSVTIGPS